MQCLDSGVLARSDHQAWSDTGRTALLLRTSVGTGMFPHAATRGAEPYDCVRAKRHRASDSLVTSGNHLGASSEMARGFRTYRSYSLPAVRRIQSLPVPQGI